MIHMQLSHAATLKREMPLRAVKLPTATAAGWPIQVLLVEDNIEAAELIRLYLTEDEVSLFRVEWAPTLRDGMIRLAHPGIEVVLLDLGLPELEGYKTYRAIEAATYKAPVVIYTSDDSCVSRDLTLGFGAAGYLLKGESSSAEIRSALRNAVMRS
jgi:DNA-binding response OmpR family regulator